MNFLINVYAWSPMLFGALPVGWLFFNYSHAKSHPVFIIYIGAFLITYSLLNVFSASFIAKAANCKRFDAGTASGCVLFGQDVSKSLYSFQVFPWSLLFVVPAGVIILNIGIVLAFGWSMMFKVFGGFIVLIFLVQFFSALINGTKK